MFRRSARNIWVFSAILLALLPALLAAAAWPLEIIELRHRTAEDVAPLVRPFLNPGETLIAHQGKLILRVAPGSMTTVRQLIDELDVKAREYVITVVQGRDISEEELFGRSSARMNVSGNRMYSQTYQLGRFRHETRSDSHDNSTQYLRTVEGHPAIIRSGEDRAIPEYDAYDRRGRYPSAGIEYREITQGFAVTPRMSGDRVTLEIAPWSDNASEINGGNINISGARTTIQVLPGEWVNLGGQTGQIERSGRGSYSTYRNTRNDSWNIYVKVERVNGEIR